VAGISGPCQGSAHPTNQARIFRSTTGRPLSAQSSPRKTSRGPTGKTPGSTAQEAAAKSERRARGASGGRTENSSAPPQPLREQRCLCTTASRSSTDATTRSAPASPDPLFFNSDPLLSSVTVAERAELSCALLDGCSGGMVLDEMPKRAVDSGFSKLPFRSGWCL